MASTFLSRTMGTSTSELKHTCSMWLKRTGIGSEQFVWMNREDGSNRTYFRFNATDTISFKNEGGSSVDLQTTQKFRDVGAWYNIVIAIDTTQATSSNRVKIYINGVQITSFSDETYPSQNAIFSFNNVCSIGSNGASSLYFDGLITHINIVDGTQELPTAFGEIDSTSGIWKPNTSPSVTYGTNGFFLKMENASAMGTDSSGNSNTFTVSGSLTKNQDTPNNNFATLNPLNAFYTNSTFSNGNTTFASGNSSTATVGNFLINTGKFYWEVKVISKSGGGDNYGIGIQGQDATAIDQFPGNQSTGWMYTAGGSYYTGGSGTSTGVTYTAGDIIGVALDCTNNKLYWSKNGTFILSGNPSAGTGGISITAPASVTLGGYYPSQTNWEATTSGTFSMNFGNGYFGTTPVSSAGTNASGNGIFEYDVPTGYTALSTKGLNS